MAGRRAAPTGRFTRMSFLIGDGYSLGRTTMLRGSRLFLAVCLVGLIAAAISCAYAQSSPPDDQADLFLNFVGDWVTLRLPHAPDTDSEARAVRSAVERSIGVPLSRVQITQNGSWTLLGQNLGLARWHGFTGGAGVRTKPLAAWLREHGYRRLTVSFTSLRTPVASAGRGSVNVSDHTYYDFYYPLILDPDRPLPETVAFKFGYRVRDLVLVLIAIMLPPLVALLLVLLARRAILHTPEPDATAGWFAYARRVGHITLGMWVVTVSAFLATDGIRVLTFLCGQGRNEPGWALSAAGAVGPAALGRLAIAASLYRVAARVRGTTWTRREMVTQTLWGLLRLLVPALCVMAGFGALLDQQPQRGVAWFLAGLFGMQFCSAQFLRSSQLAPEAVTSGELRDRIFALAERAGAKLQQIYVVSALKSKMANALAMSNSSVILTDYLIENLSKREIDAAMGHELTHIRRKHPILLARVFLFTLAFPALALLVFAFVHEIASLPGPDPSGAFVLIPLLLPAALLTTSFVSRRIETVADAGAVELTGDPEALISALVKLGRLNHVPMTMGGLTRKTVTHPDTASRTGEIARRAGIPPERLQVLLDGTSLDSERYAVQVPTNGRVYSTLLRLQLQSRFRMLCTAAILLPILAFAGMAQAANLSGATLSAAWIAGIFGAIGLFITAINFGAGMGLRRVRRDLAARLSDEGLAAAGGAFVLYSPGGEPRYYDGSTGWDAGFLTVASDHIAYRGENARFTLTAQQITEARVQYDWPGWLPASCLRIAWNDPVSGSGGEFRIVSVDGPTVLSNRAVTRRLAGSVQSLLDSGAPASGPDLPVTGEVTGLTVSEAARPQLFLRSILGLAIYAACFSTVLGLKFPPETGGAALYALGAAIALGLFQWIPYVRRRSPSAGRDH